MAVQIKIENTKAITYTPAQKRRDWRPPRLLNVARFIRIPQLKVFK
jgi:hypothetical protein